MLPFVCTITVATDAKKSNAVFLPRRSKGILVHVPALGAAGHVAKLELYCGIPIAFNDFSNPALAATHDTDWVPMDQDLNTGGGVVSTMGAQWRPLEGQWIRCTADTDQAANRVFKVFAAED